MTDKEQDFSRPSAANPGYAQWQIHKLLATEASHRDAATRDRAKQKIAKWEAVLNGMQSGEISVGSRSPIEGLPNWLTLEVITGGFATGALSAGGPLLDFERDLLVRIAPDSDISDVSDPDRTCLNVWYLTEQGFDELLSLLDTGQFQIDVPEEGALMTIAWLTRHGDVSIAKQLIEQLSPFFGQVRFYPRPAERVYPAPGKVFLRNVYQVTSDVTEIRTSQKIQTQRERIGTWIPLYERAVQLLLDHWDGEVPRLTHCDGNREVVEGGQLKSDLPIEFAAKAEAMVSEYHALKAKNKLCARPKRKDNLAQLMESLDTLVRNGEMRLSQLGRARTLCARYIEKRGLPKTEAHSARRQAQTQQISIPLFADVAKIIVARLAIENPNSGVEDNSRLVANVKEDEAHGSAPAETIIPRLFTEKIERCLLDSVDSLIAKRVITSGDTLAIVLPQITANIRAMGIADPSLRSLYSQIYQAFSKRRSLLLLNYESQTRIEELPFVAAIEKYRSAKQSARDLALQSLREIAFVQLTSFPQAIVPNKLLQEFSSLAKSAKLELPIVNELAADIFMGSFTFKFARAAKLAGKLLKNTIYSAYYSIDFNQIASISTPQTGKKWFGTNTNASSNVCDEFGKICAKRANQKSECWSVASNGTVIEQQQILTTQNLASLVSQLELSERLNPYLPAMAKTCFEWVCEQLQIVDPKFHSRLIKVKNSAYAWRQMIFYLSLMPKDEVILFLAWSKEHLKNQTEVFRKDFAFAIKGLEAAGSSQGIGNNQAPSANHPPYLGWSVGEHPLLKPKTLT